METSKSSLRLAWEAFISAPNRSPVTPAPASLTLSFSVSLVLARMRTSDSRIDRLRLLYLAGPNLTREGLMAATRKMNWSNPYAIKGVQTKTSASDRFPLSQFKLAKYTNGTFTEFGPLVNGR